MKIVNNGFLETSIKWGSSFMVALVIWKFVLPCTRYKEKEAAYDEKHRDKMNIFGFYLSFPVKYINSELLFSSSYTKNNSNMVLYDYDRTQVFFSLKKRF